MDKQKNRKEIGAYSRADILVIDGHSIAFLKMATIIQSIMNNPLRNNSNNNVSNQIYERLSPSTDRSGQHVYRDTSSRRSLLLFVFS